MTTFEPLNSKPHYATLDGLRGVAAIIVVVFHLFEAHASSHFDQIINHGYLAVDFFFVLSGFVIGYAYDDRLGKTLSLKGFFRRRLIRLQPMIVAGGLFGGLLFYYGHGSNVDSTSLLLLSACTIAACLLIPLPFSMDIRGWREMYPLNGPQWSLFFEYIANVLYALVIRRFSKGMLSLLVVIAAGLTVHFLFTNSNGDIVGGWALTGEQLYVGFVRLLYPFFAGLLISRLKLSVKVRHPFLLCSLLLACLLAMPRIGDEQTIRLNAAYEALCILILFPAIVVAGSSTKAVASPICRFLGQISYPLYLIHYPFIYMYFKYVYSSNASLAGSVALGLTFTVLSIALAAICARFYDTPVRNWLNRKFH